MSARPYKTRLICFRILTTLLYAQQDWVQIGEGGLRTFRLGTLGRKMHLTHSRLKEALAALASYGLVDGLCYPSRGTGQLTVKRPPDCAFGASPVKFTSVVRVGLGDEF